MIEFKKFKDEDINYIFLNKIEVEEENSYHVSRGKEDNSDKLYSGKNPNSVQIFLEVASKIEDYIKKKGWNLGRANNKHYIAFKYGFPVVMGIRWLGNKSMALFFKIPKDKVQSISVQEFPLLLYREQYDEANYKIVNSDVDMSKFDNLFETAYKYITGE